MKKLFLMLCGIVLLFQSCESGKPSVKAELNKMIGSRVTYPSEMMLLNNNNRMIEDYMNSVYKVISFVDSIQCNECKAKALLSWNELFPMYKKLGIPVLTIVSTPDLSSFNNAVKEIGITFPYMYDIHDEFAKNNHISYNESLRVFLTRNDTIIFVGNPAHNNTIHEMYINKLTHIE